MVEVTQGILANLGMALLHSVWQGTIAAMLVAGFRSVTQTHQSALRYGFQVIVLGLCLAAFIATFVWLQFFSSVSPDVVTGMGGAAAMDIIGAASPTFGDAVQPAGYALFIGLFWSIGFLILSARYVSDLKATTALRHQGVCRAPAHWDTRFERLLQRVNVQRSVSLRVSARVAGPVALGVLKPIVLVPAGFFTRLPSDQVEAILLHEIAHIRRHDYGVNLLQAFVRTVFFYHPAVTYMCRKIDEDREYACDEMAVLAKAQPEALARGLAALRLSAPPTGFAMAASGTDSPLLARLKRLTGQTPQTRRHGALAAASGLLMVAAALVLSVSAVPSAMAERAPHHPEVSPPAGLDGGPDGTAMIAPPIAVSIAPAPPTPPVPPMGPDFSGVDMMPGPNGEMSPEFDAAMRAFERSMEDFDVEMGAFEVEIEAWADELEHAGDMGFAHDLAHAERLQERAAAHGARLAERRAEKAEQQAERMARHAERMAERQANHATRMAEREANRETRDAERSHMRAAAEARRARITAFGDDLVDQLVRDGLIASADTPVEIMLDGGSMTLNGDILDAATTGRYAPGLRSAVEADPNAHIEITIGKNNQSISVHSDD